MYPNSHEKLYQIAVGADFAQNESPELQKVISGHVQYRLPNIDCTKLELFQVTKSLSKYT